MKKHLMRRVPAFGVPGSVLFAATALVLSMTFMVVTAGVIVADGAGILLKNIAFDAAQAGQAAFSAEETETDLGYSTSSYANNTSYVDNAVEGIIQIDSASLPSIHLNAPTITISTNGQVTVALTGTFIDSILSKAFATLVPSNPTAQFLVSVNATGQIG